MTGGDKTLWLAVFLSAQPWLLDTAAFVLGYICGSIPFGYVFSALAGLGDIRNMGSGNIGATNVLRTGGRGLALLTLAGDAGKAFLPVLAVKETFGIDVAAWVGVGAFLGHLFPVWLKFRGGKGVATYIGIVSAVYWPAGLFFCLVWLSIAALTRYSSLSALVAAVLTPLVLWVQLSTQLFIFAAALSALLIARHRRNIKNLIAGHETKIGQRA